MFARDLNLKLVAKRKPSSPADIGEDGIAKET